MMPDRPGELHVVGRRGVQLPTGWLDGFVVPSGVSIEFVDLGRRCDVQVVRGRRSATVIADLAAGVALVNDDDVRDGELVAVACSLLARRAAAGAQDQAWTAGESLLREIAAMVPSVRWMTIS